MSLMDRFHEGIGAATSASERMLQVAKLKSKLSALQKQQEDLTTEMGRTASILVRRGDVSHPQLVEIGGQIDAIEREVVTTQAEIDSLQASQAPATVDCSSCGTSIPADVKYCPACGASASLPDAVAPPGPDKTCSTCGSPLEGSGKYCARCGAPTV